MRAVPNDRGYYLYCAICSDVDSDVLPSSATEQQKTCSSLGVMMVEFGPIRNFGYQHEVAICRWHDSMDIVAVDDDECPPSVVPTIVCVRACVLLCDRWCAQREPICGQYGCTTCRTCCDRRVGIPTWRIVTAIYIWNPLLVYGLNQLHEHILFRVRIWQAYAYLNRYLRRLLRQYVESVFPFVSKPECRLRNQATKSFVSIFRNMAY